MTGATKTDVERQRAYYAQTAHDYDTWQISPDDEHQIALGWLASLIRMRGHTSVLDVGSGTGRAALWLKTQTQARVVGLEPSAELRAIGHTKGLSAEELIEGDALTLPFEDNSFDIVCAFGVLHHIADHRQAVHEMVRVARCGVFLSDANNVGQGGWLARRFKSSLRTLGLWRTFDLLRTGFRGYHYSDGDGVFYSYCIFDDVPILETKFPRVLYQSTRPSGPDLLHSAPTAAVYASRPQAIVEAAR